jgi:hypothetical protein
MPCSYSYHHLYEQLGQHSSKLSCPACGLGLLRPIRKQRHFIIRLIARLIYWVETLRGKQ